MASVWIFQLLPCALLARLHLDFWGSRRCRTPSFPELGLELKPAGPSCALMARVICDRLLCLSDENGFGPLL